MPEEPSNWGLLTRLIHEGERPASTDALPTATPIYTAATYVYPNAEALDRAFATGEGYVYARFGNPTVAQFEEVMAAAEGGAGATAFGSGMAALHAAILVAGTPDGAMQPAVRAVLASQDLYGATGTLLNDFFASQGVTVAFCDMTDLAAVDAALAEVQPSVVLVEQITNPLLKVLRMPELAQRVRAAGARLVVDNSIPTPMLQRPLTLGADLVVHSATKYLGGHGDATGGVVVARTAAQHAVLRRYCKLLGGVLGPFEAQLIARGVKTLALRMRQHCANAAAVAQWLEQQPQVARVYYPGLASHPQHDVATAQFGGLYGGMVSCELRLPAGGAEVSRAALFRFLDALRLVLPATSLGDIYTLISVPIMSSHRDLTPEQRAARGIGDGLVRLSVGIEDADDIIADLRQALLTLES